MIALTCDGAPPTANKPLRRDGEVFLSELARRFRATGAPPLSGHLYGIVYWFVYGYAVAHDSDADNISKKVWDRLEGLAFGDDKQVRLRIAGIREVGPTRSGEPEVEQLDLSVVPPEVVDEFERFLAQEGPKPGRRSMAYVEVGRLERGMFPFGLGRRE